jgi:metal-responsive CopG/Arc/MetJ family transcriptional regulator
MDEELIRAVDGMARRRGSNRSKLVRAALAQLVAAERCAALEAQHRRGYQRHPQRPEEVEPWEAIQRWPED